MSEHRLKIALVSPKGPLYRHRGGIWKKSLRYQPLTLTTLAAYVPPELDAGLQLIDEGIADAPLAWARPWINFAARLLRRPGLPAVGSTLAHAAVSHLAAPADQPAVLADLIRSLFPLARSKGVEWLTLGFAAADPRLVALQGRFAAREYRSRLYRVRWPDLPNAALDDRLPCPEIALL